VLETLARRHQLDEWRDELERVEVTRDDDRLEPLCLGLPRERADDIVGLEPGERVHRNAERLEQLLAALELGPEIVGHRLPRGLVRRLHLASERRDRQVERSCDVLRGHLLEGLQEDRGKAERRVRELALGRGERWHGEERPADPVSRRLVASLAVASSGGASVGDGTTLNAAPGDADADVGAAYF